MGNKAAVTGAFADEAFGTFSATSEGGGFADKAGFSILLTRLAFWPALLPCFPRCSGAIVPKLFPRSQ